MPCLAKLSLRAIFKLGLVKTMKIPVESEDLHGFVSSFSSFFKSFLFLLGIFLLFCFVLFMFYHILLPFVIKPCIDSSDDAFFC